MWLRKVLIILLVFLINLPLAADPPKLDETGLPSREFTIALMQTNPDLVWEMVRKLYVLERSDPVIELPDLVVIEREDGQTVVGYPQENTGNINIGTEAYNLRYEFTLKNEVLVGYKPENDILVTTLILGGVTLFCSGAVIGLLAGISSR